MSSRTGEQQPGLFTATTGGPSDPAAAGVSLEIPDGGMARITFDAPGESVNLLTSPLMERFDSLLAQVRSNGSVRGLILRSGKPGMFVAGADVDEIEGILDSAEGEGKSRRGQQVLQRIAELEVPTVAAIGGPCLGGGCEMALACDFRIASDSPKVRIGLPEVKLGILPGFGGTQRLPGVVGMAAALDLIVSGRTLNATRARRLGLVDRVVPEVHLDAQAELILQEVADRAPSARPADGGRHDWRGLLRLGRRPSRAAWLLEAVPGGSAAIAWLARKRLAARLSPDDYPAPFLALRATAAGRRLGLGRGLDHEARLLGELITTATSKNLIFIFKAVTAAKSDPGVAGPVPPLRPIRKVGVIGAGQMGSGIAAACAGAGMLVRMRDVSWEALSRGLAAAARIAEKELNRQRIDHREAERRRAAIAPAVDWTGYRAAELIIDAVVERLDIKREVFDLLEERVGEKTILASNTSSIPISQIAAGARHPERFIGLHFFNPVDRMPLVEVITHGGTDRAVTATAVDFVKRLGKTPVVVKDGPGFLVNRLLMPYLAEALVMFQEGARADEIDAPIRAFGMPMGPFEMLDRIGLDIALHVARVLKEAFGDRLPSPPALERLTSSGRLGAKSGRGFYLYGARGRRGRADTEAARIAGAGRASRAADLPGRPLGRLNALQERLILPLINEAAAALGEGVVRSAADIDLAMVLGTGFPPFRGGPLRLADTLGAANLVERLEILAGRHGSRFAPVESLRDLARSGKGFHPASHSH